MQTSYNFNPAAAVAGMVADESEGIRVLSKVASGAVPVGLACMPATDPMAIPSLTSATALAANPGQVKAWGTATDDPVLLSNFVGVPIYDSSRPPYDANNAYSDKDPVPVLRKGLIWVPVEAAVTQYADVYLRTAVNGGLTVIGGFAGAAGTGLSKLPNARWLSTTAGAGLAVLELI